jgi:hypothetical protein
MRDQEREPEISSPDDLYSAIKLLSVADVSKFELENMLDDGLACMRAHPHIIPPRIEGEDEIYTSIPVSSLIAGSDPLRSSLLKLNTDPIYCALFETRLADIVSSPELKKLSKGGRLVEASRIGSVVYSSQKCESEWFVLVSGKLKVKIEEKSQDPVDQSGHEISEGNLFGGCGLLVEEEDRCHFVIQVIQPCTFVELSGNPLKELVDDDHPSGMLVLSVLGM